MSAENDSVNEIKVVNHIGEDITPMFLEFMGVMKATLEFYENEEYMEWRGCHCHGRNVDIDNGKKASEALDKYRDFKYKLEEDYS